MSLIKKDRTSFPFINRNATKKDIVTLFDDDDFKGRFILDGYYKELKELTFKNEESKRKKFEGFTDIAMIYYFIHRQKHVDKERQLSITTKKDYMRDILQFYKHWVQYMESYVSEEVTDDRDSLRYVEPRHVEWYQTEWLVNKNYKPATIARKSIVLRSFFHWLFKVDYITTPLHEAFISSELSEQDKPDRDLTYDEVKAILGFWKERKHPINYPLLLLLATSGMRIQEVAKATWGDLFFDPSTGHYFLSSVGKNKKHREVVIFAYVLEAIRVLRKRRRFPIELNHSDASPLIPTQKGNFYDHTYLSRYVSDIIKKTELPFLQHKKGDISPHWFRHFFANHSLDNGANLEYIRQTLGHSMLKTTQGYLRKNMERKNNAALKWNQTFF